MSETSNTVKLPIVTGTISYFIYQGRRYANTDSGLTLLSEAMVDRAKTKNRLGLFTIVFADHTRCRRSVVSLFSRAEIRDIISERTNWTKPRTPAAL